MAVVAKGLGWEVEEGKFQALSPLWAQQQNRSCGFFHKRVAGISTWSQKHIEAEQGTEGDPIERSSASAPAITTWLFIFPQLWTMLNMLPFETFSLWFYERSLPSYSSFNSISSCLTPFPSQLLHISYFCHLVVSLPLASLPHLKSLNSNVQFCQKLLLEYLPALQNQHAPWNQILYLLLGLIPSDFPEDIPEQ